jgi:hypothetical protein
MRLVGDEQINTYHSAHDSQVAASMACNHPEVKRSRRLEQRHGLAMMFVTHLPCHATFVPSMHIQPPMHASH